MAAYEVVKNNYVVLGGYDSIGQAQAKWGKLCHQEKAYTTVIGVCNIHGKTDMTGGSCILCSSTHSTGDK